MRLLYRVFLKMVEFAVIVLRGLSQLVVKLFEYTMYVCLSPAVMVLVGGFGFLFFLMLFCGKAEELGKLKRALFPKRKRGKEVLHPVFSKN